jgi:hypothetical protein
MIYHTDTILGTAHWLTYISDINDVSGVDATPVFR